MVCRVHELGSIQRRSGESYKILEISMYLYTVQCTEFCGLFFWPIFVYGLSIAIIPTLFRHYSAGVRREKMHAVRCFVAAVVRRVDLGLKKPIVR